MKLEITKRINLTGLGLKKIGDEVEIAPKDGGDILLSMGFAKESEKPKATAAQVAELIDKTETIEELRAFESDDRQVVRNAFNKKLKELE